MPIFGRRYLIVGYVTGNVVTGHDVLHPALVLANIVPVVLADILLPLFVDLIELVLIVGQEPARGIVPITVVVSRSCDLFVGNVGRNVVASHNVLHPTDIPIDVIPVVLTSVAHPSFVRAIEFTLVVWREAALVSPIRTILLVCVVVAVLLGVSAAGDLLVGNVGGNVVTGHNVLHSANVSIDVIPVVLAA